MGFTFARFEFVPALAHCQVVLCFCVAPVVARTRLPFLLNTDWPEVIGLVNHYATVFVMVKMLTLNHKLNKWKVSGEGWQNCLLAFGYTRFHRFAVLLNWRLCRVGHVFRQPLAVKHATGELLLLPLLRSLLWVLQVLLLGVVNKQALPLSRILVVYISCYQTSSFLSYATLSLNASVGRDTLVVWNKSRDRNAGDPLHGKTIMVCLPSYVPGWSWYPPVLEKLSIGTKTLFGRDIYIGRKLHCGIISHVEINTPTPMNQRATCEGIFCGTTHGGVGSTHN
jgi:hypothetical protein